MAKRYVLLMSEREITDEDRNDLARLLVQRHGKVTLIPVEANPRAVIVKTSNAVAPILRDSSGELNVGGKILVTILTSGSIGKLKKRASETGATQVGKVP